MAHFDGSIKPRWGTRTARGDTCFTGLTTRAQAAELARQWSKRFPAYAPYQVTRNGVAAP